MGIITETLASTLHSLLGNLKTMILGLQPVYGDFILLAVALGLGYIIYRMFRRTTITRIVVTTTILIYLVLVLA